MQCLLAVRGDSDGFFLKKKEVIELYREIGTAKPLNVSLKPVHISLYKVKDIYFGVTYENSGIRKDRKFRAYRSDDEEELALFLIEGLLDEADKSEAKRQLRRRCLRWQL